MTPKLPKISCLTATLDRLVLLKESIHCYLEQSYPNRELVIATEGDEWYKQATLRYVRSLDRNDIKLVFLDGDNYNLGKVRNILLDEAEGDIVCQWDDDDLNHPERLRVQAEHLLEQKAQACLMTDQLQYFYPTRELYWVDWAPGIRENVYKYIPGTLIMHRDSRFRYPETGAHARAGEDFALLADLCKEVAVTPLSGAGMLYVYCYHGSNTYDHEHHKNIIASRSCSVEFAMKRIDIVKKALAAYRLPRPFPVTVQDDKVLFIHN